QLDPAATTRLVHTATGNWLVTGGLTTTTVKLQELVLPLTSLARQLTVFVPSGKAEPEGGSQFNAGLASQLSVAVTTHVTNVVSFEANTVRFVGQVNSGAVVSLTITVASQALVPPWPSETTSTTKFVPNGYGPG